MQNTKEHDALSLWRQHWSTTVDIHGAPQTRGETKWSASPAWLAAPAMNARDTTKVYIWRFDTGCGPTLYRKCHSHNTPGKRHNNTWVEISYILTFATVWWWNTVLASLCYVWYDPVIGVSENDCKSCLYRYFLKQECWGKGTWKCIIYR